MIGGAIVCGVLALGCAAGFAGCVMEARDKRRRRAAHLPAETMVDRHNVEYVPVYLPQAGFLLILAVVFAASAVTLAAS